MILRKMIKSLNGIRQMKQINFCAISTNGNKRSYEDAIIALNSLQSNSVSLNLSIQMRQQQKHDEANFNLCDTVKYMERIDNFNLKSFDKLSVIHISGSKGKGSVCMYTDAILREYKAKTGLFTSPHLVSVTERIKLSGKSISKNLFTKYFWEVYDALQRKKSHETDLPSYFKFLQVMAFYIFVKENVDVAIIEVGIGGQFDSTNIIRNTEIVGITALQLEHTQLLGNTLKDIAWQKAGIIKKDSHVYSMNQPSECIKVINDRFEELKGKRLSYLPSFSDYKFIDCDAPDFSQTADVNKMNFSLASQISACWLRNRKQLSEDYFNDDDVLTSIDKNFIDAYEKCNFEGRFQRIEDNGLTYFLDGAHTVDSVRICAEWMKKQLINKDEINILVFNVTGDRDAELILQQLHSINFNLVCFTTNILDNESYNEKCENFTGVLKTTQLEKCIKHKEIWLKKFNDANVLISPTIQSTIDHIQNLKQNNATHINVLFTGSLHLIGSSLKIINERTKKQ